MKIETRLNDDVSTREKENLTPSQDSSRKRHQPSSLLLPPPPLFQEPPPPLLEGEGERGRDHSRGRIATHASRIPDRERSRRGLGFPSQSGAMVGCSRGSLPTWMTAAAARVDLSAGVTPSHQGSSSPSPSSSGPAPAVGADQELGMFERALSTVGAAFVSAIIINPLDVAKVGSPGHSLPHSRRTLLLP